MKNLEEFYGDKTVLVTGCTGFKGSWLCVWLKELGAKVRGLSLRPAHDEDDFNICGLEQALHFYPIDILDYSRVQSYIFEIKPDIVFHLAAQSLVVPSYQNPYGTFQTNIQGTINLLESLRQAKLPRTAVVVVTSDKVYKPVGSIYGLRETDVLGGDNPYSASKACVELIVNAYNNSYFRRLKNRYCKVVTARAGNIIGGGDWNDYRIVPDIMKTFRGQKSQPLTLRHPDYVRPWQYILDPLYGYLLLGKGVYEDILPDYSAWNFGPARVEQISVKTLTKKFRDKLYKLYTRAFEYSEEENFTVPEDKNLVLDSTLAYKFLRWKQRVSFNKMIDWTVRDYGNVIPFFSETYIDPLRNYMERVNRINQYYNLLKKGR